MNTKSALSEHRWTAVIVDIAATRPYLILGCALLLTVFTTWFSIENFALDTNTENMLDPSLPFRQQQAKFDKLFPLLSGNIVIVVDGLVNSAVEDATASIAERLRKEPERIASVFDPLGEEYFASNGLLFLSVDELWQLDADLATAAPFLGTLARDPSLRGVFALLGNALDQNPDAGTKLRLAAIIEQISEVIDAQLQGKVKSIDWRGKVLAKSQPKEIGERRYLLVRPRVDYATLSPGDDALELIDTIAAKFNAEGTIRVRYTGSIAMEIEELENVAADGTLITVVSLGFVLTVLLTGLRSARITAAVLLTLCLGLAWTTAFALAVYGRLTLISVSFAVLFIGMGVDFGIQLSMRYRESLMREKATSASALRESALGIGSALSFAAGIAALTFFAFSPTSYRGLAELGVIAGFGMGIALLANLTVLPAILALWRHPKVSSPVTGNWLAPLGEVIERHSHAILIVAGVLTIGALFLAPNIRFDFNPLNLRDPTTPAVTTFKDLLADTEFAPYSIDLIAADMAEASALAKRLELLPEVEHVVTLASFVPENQNEKLEIIDAINVALIAVTSPGEPTVEPTTRENQLALETIRDKLSVVVGDDKFAQASHRLQRSIDALSADTNWPRTAIADLEPRLLGDLPGVLSRLRRLLAVQRVTEADIPIRIAERYIAADGSVRLEVVPKENLRDNYAMRQFVEAVRHLAPQASGAPVDMVEGGDAVIAGTKMATLFALIATVLVFVAILRQAPAVFAALLPLLLAILWSLGAAAFLGLALNFANIIAVPLVIGLGNAFGLYLVLRWQQVGSVQQLFASSSPAAVLFSGVTTSGSFGALALARHPGMSNMGILIALTIVLSLFASLIVLPAVLTTLNTRPNQPRP